MNYETIAGYPLHDDGTPFPGGKWFATTHPTTQAPVVVRRYRGEWFAPADSLDGFHERVRTTLGMMHPHLATARDAGFVGSDVYVVLDPFEGASLEALVKDIGPMPLSIAADYVRQAALGLMAAHERGLIHGDVRPSHIFAGPLLDMPKQRADGSTMQRPAPDAAAKLCELGLMPKRPGGREWAALDPLATKPLGFLPPERVAEGHTSIATDVYGLGATLFFVLTGRAPYVANSAMDVVNAIETTPHAPLAPLRPDLPVSLVELVNKLLARNPAERPATARQVAEALAAYAEPEPIALTKAPTEEAPPVPNAWTFSDFTTNESAVPMASGGHNPFSAEAPAIAVEEKPKPKKAVLSEAERNKLKLWMYLGIAFWVVVAPILWFVLLSDGCTKKTEAPKQQATSGKRPTR